MLEKARGPSHTVLTVVFSAARAAGAEILTGATAWGAFAPDEIGALVGDTAVTFRPRRLVIAAGAHERPVPIPGWTLPGVMTTGALQANVYLQHYKPFERPVIIGSELVAFSAILTCRHLGIRPVAMIEAKDRISAPRPGDLVAKLVYGVPVWTRTRLIAIEGRTQVEAVEIERNGQRERVACDGVIFTGEWVPEAALLVNKPKVTLAGNVHGALKTSGACWRDGRVIAEQVARELA
jgi:NADPH-dependent 2,4-dienoyl-CoA reductase/sulfur reductase-like enzyme